MKTSLGAKPLMVPAPVWVIGTYDQDDKPNIMTIAWGGICCSSPACLTISLREATHSHACILHRKGFTVNIATQEYIAQADFCGIASGRDTNKFTSTKLTPIKSDLVDAPCIQEFPMVAECKLVQTVELGLHTMFVGEILDIKADPAILDPKGRVDVEKLRPAVFSPGLRAYHGLGKHLGPAFSIGKDLAEG
jgi:flavin reductase (DIM6/NTAB) family NADH-FMN oxidoreductase RutF